MRKAIVFVVAVVCLSSLVTSAADFWEKKDYTKWSQGECEKMLNNSPWARQWVWSYVQMPRTYEGSSTERRPNVQYGYTFQLRSALPIRQALVRRSQWAQGYDKMTDEQKLPFDQQTQQFLSATFPDKVVVYVEYFSNVGGWVQELSRFWKNQTTQTVGGGIYLIGANGLRAPLWQYTPSRGDTPGFQLVFPRMVDGRPLVGPEDKSLQVQFFTPLSSGVTPPERTGISSSTLPSESNIQVEFKVQKMIVNGEVVY